MPGVFNQFMAATISSLSIFSAGGCYVWTATLINRLTHPGAEIFMTPSDVALTVSIIDLGNFLTPIPCAYLSDMIGRKMVLLLSGPFFFFGALMPIIFRSVPALVVMRFLQGLANGAVYAILPLYLGELAEPRLRGAFSVFFTVFLFLGMLVTFIVGKFSNYMGVSWLITVEPVVFMLLFALMPETPHYYILNDKREKAAKALKFFRGAKKVQDIDDELEDVTREVKDIPSIPLHSTERIRTLAKNPWKELFSSRIGLRSLALGNLVVATQVMGGFFSVYSFAADTLTRYKEENSTIDGILVSIIFTIITLLLSLLALFLVDVMGRRAMLLTSGSISCVTASLCASYFYMADKTKINMYPLLWILYTSMIILAAGLNFALGALIPTLQAELFPTSTRSIASSIMASTQAGITFYMLYIYFPIYDAGVCFLNYVHFAVATALGTCLIYLFFPETKGKTFAEIQRMLS